MSMVSLHRLQQRGGGCRLFPVVWRFKKHFAGVISTAENSSSDLMNGLHSCAPSFRISLSFWGSSTKLQNFPQIRFMHSGPLGNVEVLEPCKAKLHMIVSTFSCKYWFVDHGRPEPSGRACRAKRIRQRLCQWIVQKIQINFSEEFASQCPHHKRDWPESSFSWMLQAYASGFYTSETANFELKLYLSREKSFSEKLWVKFV